jgi:Ca-activated chloride channel homolog
MTLDPDDPRLTAFALGELDSTEHALIEAMLIESPEGRMALEEIRQTSRWLTEQLHAESKAHAATVSLNNHTVPQSLLEPAQPRRPWWRRRTFMLQAVAALLLLGVAITFSPILRLKEQPPAILAQADRAPAASLAHEKSTSFASGKKLKSIRILSDETAVAADGTSYAAPAAKPGMATSSAPASAPAPPLPALGESKSGATALSAPLAGRQSTGRRLAGGGGAGPAGQPRAGSAVQAPESRDYYYRAQANSKEQNADRLNRLFEANQRAIRGDNRNQERSLAAGATQGSGRSREAARNEMLAGGEGFERSPKGGLNGQLGQMPGNARDAKAGQKGQGLGREPEAAVRLQKQSADSQLAAQNAPGQSPAQNGVVRSQAKDDAGQSVSQKLSDEALSQNADGKPSSQNAAPQPKSPGAVAQAPQQNVAAQDAEQNLGLLVREQQQQQQPQPMQEMEAAPAANFAAIIDNPFQRVVQDPLSTFSIDVDTASYSIVRGFLAQNMAPPADAVRVEEMLNYFPYHDPAPPPSSEHPFTIHTEVASCPWNAQHRLARIGIAAMAIDQSRRPPSNLVFLVDVSGSMDAPNRLPLVQWGLQRLVEQLGENDHVAIVVYAGAAGLVLPSTSCINKAQIDRAIDQLKAGGSTNGGAGIQLAYDVAVKSFIKNGTNRVILTTDGDFNVGIDKKNELVDLIKAKAKSGVYLSVLGFGMSNLKDDNLQSLAANGNGHYEHIQTPNAAYKVLVEQMGSTLITVAKDVKIQVKFNPTRVAEFRLIGYENRIMSHQDFNDDTKDAGEIGAGHHVTALYEIAAPQTGPNQPARGLEPLGNADAGRQSSSAESLTVTLRYKKPTEDTSRVVEEKVVDKGLDFGHASADLKFAASVAGFGMLLRESPYKGSLTFDGLLEMARATLVEDQSGYRREFVELVSKAQLIKAPPVAAGPAAP